MTDVVLRANETHRRAEELLVRTRTIGQELQEHINHLIKKEHAMSEQTLSEGRAVLVEPLRKEIFRALVDVQDNGIPVAESRMAVAAHFGVTERQVRQIEREGLDHEWPPLENAV